jgi:threonyl-tRNA synthetase
MKIALSSTSVRDYPNGVTPMQIAESIDTCLAKEVFSASVNGKMWDLLRPIYNDSSVRFYKWKDIEGKHTYWHSSAHLLAGALHSLYPNIRFGTGPAIENGFYYDVDLGDKFVIKDADFVFIENKMRELARKKIPICRRNITKQNALKLFKERGEIYKVELINKLENCEIVIYTQGDFIDLCLGPHLPNTSYIRSFKLTAVAGAYWNKDKKQKQLTRIYGVSFPSDKELNEYFALIDEVKKRDHRRIGKEMELFTFSSKVGQGLPLWLPKGTQLRLKLEDFLKKIQQKYNYQQVITPHIGNKMLYEISGHYAKYGENSFKPINTPEEGEEFLLRPMNCPHHCEIYKAFLRSYKELPIRLAEFGTVYRYEQSGELHGLTRVRGFTQDDAHIFCSPEQIKEEFVKVINIVHVVLHALNFNNYETQISLRNPNDKLKYIGSEENWKNAEMAILEVCQEKKIKAEIKLGEAAFYGPKLDFLIKDSLGRKWQLGTIQVDYNLPERFELEYIGNDNQKHRPVMIHRALFGSIERFVAILIEHSGGKFPLWLVPSQVVIIPVSEKYNQYAEKIAKKLYSQNIRVVVDNSNEKIGKKIRNNELRKIPYLLIVGKKEENNSKLVVSVRKHGVGNVGVVEVTNFVGDFNNELEKQIKYNSEI